MTCSNIKHTPNFDKTKLRRIHRRTRIAAMQLKRHEATMRRQSGVRPSRRTAASGVTTLT